MRTLKITPLLVLLALIVGCASVRSITVSITETVEVVMSAYMDMKVAGNVPADVDAKVRVAYAHYNQVSADAKQSLLAYKSGIESGDPSKAVLDAVRVAASGLVDILDPILEKALVKQAKDEIAAAERI